MGLGLSAILTTAIWMIITTVLQVKLSLKEKPLFGLLIPICIVLLCLPGILSQLVIGSVLLDHLPSFVFPYLAGVLFHLIIYGICRYKVNHRQSNRWDNDTQPFYLQETQGNHSLEYHSKKNISFCNDPIHCYQIRRNRLILAVILALAGPLVLLFPLAMNLSSFNLAFSLSYLPPFFLYLFLLRHEIKKVWTRQMGLAITGTILSNFLFILQSELVSLLLMPITLFTVAYTGKELLSHYRNDRDLGVIPHFDVKPPQFSQYGRAFARILLWGSLLFAVFGIAFCFLLPHDTIYRLDSITLTMPSDIKRLSDDQFYNKKQKATYTINVQHSHQNYQLLLEEEVESVRSDPLVTNVYRLANHLANRGFSSPKYPEVNALRLHTSDAQTCYYDIVVSEWGDQTLQMTAITGKGERILCIKVKAPISTTVEEIHGTIKKLLYSAA